MEDWKNVSMYKGIGDKNKCANYTTISLLNVSENVWGRILITNI